MTEQGIETAVEAACNAIYAQGGSITGEDMEAALQAAYPALRASVLQEVREGLLSDEALAAATKRQHPLWQGYEIQVKERLMQDSALAIQAALDSIGGEE